MDIGELVVRHVDWIRRQARFYYTNEEDADDLASETIYKCLNQGRLFDPGRNFKPWIVAIMSNTYITQYNRRRCVMFTRIDDDIPTGTVKSRIAAGRKILHEALY